MQIYSDKKAIARRRRLFRIKIYFYLFLFSLVVFGVYYLLAYSSVFKVKTIEINNNKFLTDEQVMTVLKRVVLGSEFAGQAGFDNLWSWPSGKIASSDPVISEIVIRKNWFKKIINVDVFERNRFAIWCTSSGYSCYWIDEEGMVFTPAPLTEGSLVYTVFDNDQDVLYVGSKVEEDRFINNLISVLQNLNKINFEINKVVYMKELKEMKVFTVNGPELFLSTRFDGSKNLSLIKDLNLENAEYIDLRVENKVYYKNK